jgi:EpsI family protein
MLARTMIVVLALATAAVWLPRAAVQAVPLRAPLAELPATIGEWHSRSETGFDDEIVRVLGVDEYVNRLYQRADGPVLGLYVGYYERQREGETIHSPQNCLPGAGWQPVASDRMTLRSAAGDRLEVNRYLVQKGVHRQVVLYWYEGRGRAIASEYRNKLYLMWDALRAGRTDGALVRVMTPVGESEGDAERQAVAFATALHPVLRRHMQQ